MSEHVAPDRDPSSPPILSLSDEDLMARVAEDDRRKTERLPCHLKLETRARGTLPVYEISMDGVLIGGADAAKLAR